MNGRQIVLGLAISLAVGGILSLFASPEPDGLERVAEDEGFIGRAVDRPLVESPMPDYRFPGIADERLATGVSGFIGTLLVFVVGWGIAALARKKGRAGASTPGDVGASAADGDTRR